MNGENGWAALYVERDGATVQYRDRIPLGEWVASGPPARVVARASAEFKNVEPHLPYCAYAFFNRYDDTDPVLRYTYRFAVVREGDSIIVTFNLQFAADTAGEPE